MNDTEISFPWACDIWFFLQGYREIFNSELGENEWPTTPGWEGGNHVTTIFTCGHKKNLSLHNPRCNIEITKTITLPYGSQIGIFLIVWLIPPRKGYKMIHIPRVTIFLLNYVSINNPNNNNNNDLTLMLIYQPLTCFEIPIMCVYYIDINYENISMYNHDYFE